MNCFMFLYQENKEVSILNLIYTGSETEVKLLHYVTSHLNHTYPQGEQAGTVECDQ